MTVTSAMPKDPLDIVTDTNGPRLEVWPIERVKPYDKNPRTLPEKAVQKVVGSLKQFGFQKPIVVDEQGVVIAGHVVLKAAQQAGFPRVPVLISSLDAKAAKAYRLADNRTAQETDWLEDLLKDELTALDEADFDLASLGFDDRELQKLLSDERYDQTDDCKRSYDAGVTAMRENLENAA